MGDTIQKPGGDSAVIRIHGKNKGVAITVDSSAHYCLTNPMEGGKQVVCETWRNLISVGSNPIAITNCLNFGNPEKKENMGEFVECIHGIREASKYLDYPVVSGNVSFYNGTNKKNIYPTPVIGGVGLIPSLKKPIDHKFKEDDSVILLIGKTFGHLEQSVFLEEIYSILDGKPPEINLVNEKNNGESVLEIIKKDLVNSVHDISNGGLIIALAEMSMGSNYGIKINKTRKLTNPFKYFFGEDQGRYILEVNKNNLEKIEKILKNNNIFYENIGLTQKNYFEIEGELKIDVKELYKINNQWYNSY